MSLRDINKMVTRMKARAISMRVKPAKRKKPGRAPVQLPPKPVEIKYQAILRAYMTSVEQTVNKVIMPTVPRLIEQANYNKPVTDRLDDWASDLDRMMDALNVSLDKSMPPFGVITLDIGQKTSKWNNVQWQKTLRQTMGVDLVQNEPWLNDQLVAFSKENVSLINSLQDTALKDVQSSVLSNIRTGGRAEDVSKSIQERFDVSRSRANLIARDQVSKLNGQLTELRQNDIGVTEYIWHTAQDERVRKTHKAHNGKKFKWSQPPKDTGHPGNDYQCRCWAEAVLDEIINPTAPVAPEPTQPLPSAQPAPVPPAPAPAPVAKKKGIMPTRPAAANLFNPSVAAKPIMDDVAAELDTIGAVPKFTAKANEDLKYTHASVDLAVMHDNGDYLLWKHNIRLNDSLPRAQKRQTAFHEIGHNLDDRLSEHGYWASDEAMTRGTGKAKALMDVIKDTPEYKEWAVESVSSIAEIAKNGKYLSEPTELFARAYHQYVSTHPKALETTRDYFAKQYAREGSGSYRSRHWTEEHFKAIRVQMDKILKQKVVR